MKYEYILNDYILYIIYLFIKIYLILKNMFNNSIIIALYNFFL